MALADIIRRIESDASAEAESVRAAAQERASSLVAVAEESARVATEQTLTAAEKTARREAETVVVNARLQVRDGDVTAKRVLIDSAIGAVAERIAALPDDAYAAFVGGRVAADVTGPGELRIGTDDASRAKAILEAVRQEKPSASVELADEPAPFARGVLFVGDRVRADLSLPAIVAARRDDLELAIAGELFGEEG